MKVLVDKLRISGFRGIKDIEISLSRVALLIGMNNSGKTSVVKALQLALGDYSRYLTDEDFHIASDDTRCEEIIVDIRIVPTSEDGNRDQSFHEDWIQEFEDKIRAEANGYQFLALRTTACPDKVKGGFTVEHYALDRWPTSSWKNEKTRKENQIRRRYDSLPFISVDAQRDIHQDLRDKTSFVGKVLSSVKYQESEIRQLEEMIAEINQEAVEKSEPLKRLKKQLNALNQSFEGSGQAELTPFPKKIRDLSKRFSIHFGESDKNSFSIEYHGMGTRSWASMLAVKAFIELMANNHKQEDQPFFPIITVEEPESHLHPNAQRTLYQQLTKDPLGQVIISTHSPYLPAISSLYEICGLKKTVDGICVRSLSPNLDSEEINMLRREIMRLRGEILFAKALILFEGPTEEQLVPAMFELYHGCPPFEKGVNCVSVNGKNYKPFLIFAFSFDIPVCIVSDNDGKTKKEVKSIIKKIKEEQEFCLNEQAFSLEFLSKGNDMEPELLKVLQLREEIIEALIAMKTRGNPRYDEAKRKKLERMDDEDLLEEMDESKPAYASFLSDVIIKNPNGKKKNELIPKALIKSFKQIEEWIEP